MPTDLLLLLLSAKSLYQLPTVGLVILPLRLLLLADWHIALHGFFNLQWRAFFRPIGPQSTAAVHFSPAPTSGALAVIFSQTDT